MECKLVTGVLIICENIELCELYAQRIKLPSGTIIEAWIEILLPKID